MQVKKLIQKVVSRESFNYRKLTDVPVGEDESDNGEHLPVEIDVEKLAAGKTCMKSSCIV